ncbi:MAG TPA: HupE/UreJ family protein [Kiloniellales bacterium]|nr:HupE/UreJ family protein [Kiloniellales bacterium]
MALLAFILPAQAHEVRPAYLEIREEASEVYEVLWKVPARGEARLALAVELPQACSTLGAVDSRLEGTVHRQAWRVRCAGGLAGQEIAIQGLAGTITDAIVRLVPAEGAIVDRRLTPAAPSFTVPAAPSGWDVVATYTLLGVEHILLGFDHLLFVLALLLLVRGGWSIVKTVTAFTVAHSITLAAAVLGYVALPPAPVETVIALSIVFLASEICRVAAGEAPFAARRPWLVAFAFGLLHGFGFAGALTSAGLPQDAVPLALVTFNLGVEAGQLAFIAVVLPLLALLRLWFRSSARAALVAGAYMIGGLASAWMIERLVAIA